MNITREKINHFIHRFLPKENLEHVKLVSTADTIEQIMVRIMAELPGAYIRISDGEINILNGQNDAHHKANKMLTEELKAVLNLKHPGVMRAVSIHSKKFGLEKGMKPGVHEWPDKRAEQILRTVYKYLRNKPIYSNVALHYSLVFNPELAQKFFLFIRSYNPIFIGGEIDSELLYRLLNTEDHIQIPTDDFYTQINETEAALKSLLDKRGKDYDVVMVSAGVGGKALIKRMLNKYKRPVFYFDLGSVIEVFKGKSEWAWVQMANKPKEYWEQFLQ